MADQPTDFTPAVSEDVSTPAKKTKAKEKPIRSIEALDAVSPRTMSEVEMRRYIDHLREVTAAQVANIDQLTKSCQSAFEQSRTFEKRYSDLRMKAQAKLQFAQQAISTCHNAIILAGGID